MQVLLDVIVLKGAASGMSGHFLTEASGKVGDRFRKKRNFTGERGVESELAW